MKTAPAPANRPARPTASRAAATRRQQEQRRRLREMPATLPESIQTGLRALTRRVLAIAWTEGVLRWLVGGCVCLPVQAAADLLFDLPWRTRAVLLGADVAACLWLFARHLVLPWHRRLLPEQAAALAERRWPQFRTSLISAVQLAREPDGSPLLVAALLRQAGEQSTTLDLRAASAWSRLRRLAVVTLTLVVAAAALAWWTRPDSVILARRLLLSNEPLPTRTVVEAISRDLAVVPGESVELSARARGEIPRSGRLELAYPGKPVESVPLTSRPATPDVFSLALPNVQQPFTYRFYLNDGRGLEWKVSLLHPPVIQKVGFRQIYPAYTGLAPLALSGGNLRLLAGSRLAIEGRASQPLRAARIAPQGGAAPIEAKVAADGLDFRGELPTNVKGPTGFSVLLQNSQGVDSRLNTTYAIEIVPDLPPTITIAPGQPEKTTLIATAQPGLRFAVSDDFLVQKVTLLVQAASSLGEGEQPDPAKAQRIPIALSKSARTLSFDYRWNEPGQTVKWEEGNTFYYWIEAADNNDVTGPGIARTAVREWSIVSLKTKHDELADHLRQNAELIDNLSNSERDLQNRVGDLLKENHPPAP